MESEQAEINMLRELLDYNPDTGVFRWKWARGGKGGKFKGPYKGAIAGSADRGRRRLKVLRRVYAAHRVAFAFTYDRWPQPFCEHINGESLDNRIVNLRETADPIKQVNSRVRNKKHWHAPEVKEIVAKATSDLEMLQRLLNYNPETGDFTWKYRMGPEALPGTKAGCVVRGYWKLALLKRNFLGHRVAFALTHGRWPEPECDHINGNGLDNRICNLREATHAQNLQNRGVFSNNSVGVKGVFWNQQDKRWRVKVGFGGKHIYCGSFKTIEEAAAAASRKRKELHGEFARD